MGEPPATSRLTGEVKFFNSDKGYGFIKRDDQQPDVFVHVSDVLKSNLHEIGEGDKLSFCLGDGKKGHGKKAVSLERVKV